MPSMERLGTYGGDSGVRGVVPGGNGAMWMGVLSYVEVWAKYVAEHIGMWEVVGQVTY